ncbi:MAG: hypothetical protein M5U34_30765 [Chloroflexi bacterium]|nr:hypothetical protein [Chloroflexota bacterium]
MGVLQQQRGEACRRGRVGARTTGVGHANAPVVRRIRIQIHASHGVAGAGHGGRINDIGEGGIGGYFQVVAAGLGTAVQLNVGIKGTSTALSRGR